MKIMKNIFKLTMALIFFGFGAMSVHASDAGLRLHKADINKLEDLTDTLEDGFMKGVTKGDIRDVSEQVSSIIDQGNADYRTVIGMDRDKTAKNAAHDDLIDLRKAGNEFQDSIMALSNEVTDEEKKAYMSARSKFVKEARVYIKEVKTALRSGTVQAGGVINHN